MALLSSDRYTRLSRPLPRAPLAVAVLSVALMVAGAFGRLEPLAALSIYALAISIVFILMRRWKEEQGTLDAGFHGVRWNGRVLAARGDLAAGMVVPGAGGVPMVRLEKRHGRAPLYLRAPDEEAARALLRALGLDASQSALDLAFGARIRGSNGVSMLWALSLVVLPILLLVTVPIALIALANHVVAPMIACGALALFTALWAVINIAGTRVRIGVDGVLVTWLFTRRFVAYDDLEDVVAYADGGGAGVALSLHGGETLRLPRMGAFSMQIDRGELDLVVHRIKQAVASQRAARAERGLTLPAPRGRDTKAWIGALRAVGTGARSDHRTAPVDADRLLRIVEDAGSDPEARAAAAVAFSGVADPTGRERLRVAAATTVEPDLKAILALAAEEQAAEDELAAAMDRVVRPAGDRG